MALPTRAVQPGGNHLKPLISERDFISAKCQSRLLPAPPSLSARHRVPFAHRANQARHITAAVGAADAAGTVTLRGNPAVVTLDPDTVSDGSRTEAVRVPGGKGKAVRLRKGQLLKVVNTYGQQVVDFWAFCLPNLHEMMSWHHARYAISRMMPKAGDVLVTNQRQPILTFLEDTGPGLHDTTVAACDYNLYLEELGKEGADEHDSCINNLHTALGELGLELLDPAGRKLQPAPLNLWMSGLPVHAPATEADLYWAEPPKGQKPGDYVIFRAEQDCVAAMSACPYDILPISGTEGPKDVHFAVEG